jgi:hypothetical protein
LSFQHAPVDNHAGGAAPLANGEGRDDDIGRSAVILQRRRVANERHLFSLHGAA